MKKRVVSLLLAVTFLVTALPYMPVIVTEGAGHYEVNPAYGHWGDSGSLRFYHDGDYSRYVATEESDPAYKTRHVTVFNDCSKQEITYTSGTTTPRGPFTNVVDEDNYYTTSEKLTNISAAPYIVYDNGATGSLATDPKGTRGTVAKFIPEMSEAEGAQAVGACDVRMIFRNYFNTDITSYDNGGTPAGRTAEYAAYSDSASPFYNKEGLDINNYEYIEFDLYISSDVEISQSANTDYHANRIYFYYETNDATRYYLSADDCIAEYAENVNDFSFTDQLYNDDGTLKLAKGEWHTIRCSLKNITTHSPIKQVTIRIYDKIAAQGYFLVDDVRFVKNDDHTDAVVKAFSNEDGSLTLTESLYPSGEYFMINDFETMEGVRQKDADSKVYSTTYALARRFEETNTDDTCSYAKSAKARGTVTGSNDFGWLNGSAAWADGNYYYMATEDLVTQGEYATVLQARSGGDYNKEVNYSPDDTIISAFYYKDFNASLDLSKYTHFAMDMYIRPISGSRNLGMYTTGVATEFVLTLITDTDGTVNKEAGFDVSFRLVVGSSKNGSPFDDIRGANNGIPQVIPISENGSFALITTTNYSSYGAMRLIFTREDLMRYFTAGSGADLSNINAMRFAWINGTKADGAKNNNDYDIVLDNFIAYTPDTSVTIKTELPHGVTDEDAVFEYQVYGGYQSNEEGFVTTQKGADPITKDVDVTVTVVPGTEGTTICNMPFNSCYISQTDWSWRYKVASVSSTLADAGDLKAVTYNGNTATVQPQVAWCSKSTDGCLGAVHEGSTSPNCSYITPIYSVLNKRNYTVTFKQERIVPNWLDDNTIRNNVFT